MDTFARRHLFYRSVSLLDPLHLHSTSAAMEVGADIDRSCSFLVPAFQGELVSTSLSSYSSSECTRASLPLRDVPRNFPSAPRVNPELSD